MARAEQLRPGVNLPEFKAPHKHTLNKIIAGVLAIPVIAAGIKFGVDDYFNSNNDNNIIIPPTRPTVEDTLKLNSSPTPHSSENTPTVSPTEPQKVTPTPSPEKVLSALEKRMQVTPELEGAKKVIQDNGLGMEITYIAEANNPYGVEAGKYLGVTRENVTLNGEKVKGVVLTAEGVKELLAKKNGQAIFIPCDISEIKDGTENIKLDFLGVVFNGQEYKNFILKVDTNGAKVSFSNYLINQAINSKVIVPETSITYPNYFTNGIKPLSDNKNKYDLRIVGNFNFPEPFQKIFPFGYKLTETDKQFGMYLNTLTGPESIKDEDILKNEGYYVFLQDNG